ncbi:hypothetical protein SLEP1_g59275 [Rubroshorea leprosula]|uniref:NADH dehydrogenase subunit 2 n=1 Tax=Rubroshorea leprosula TaxID=152421 RepID=A0AAV5MSY4_9ROSI|nr:hypothetical protein SLEP1_g59275 [Rubroshorea leprosula]
MIGLMNIPLHHLLMTQWRTMIPLALRMTLLHKSHFQAMEILQLPTTSMMLMIGLMNLPLHHLLMIQ